MEYMDYSSLIPYGIMTLFQQQQKNDDRPDQVQLCPHSLFI